MREDLRYIENLIEDIEYTSHPSDEELANFIDNRLIGDAKEEVMNHLIHCYQCREVFNEVIEYKKKPRFFNNIIVATPLVALVASLLVFVYLPQDMIGMIDLSKTPVEFRAEQSKKSGIIDGDSFLEEIQKSTNVKYLEKFNQAEEERDFDIALGLYQEAINAISENVGEQERLKETIIIRSRILHRAIDDNNKMAMDSYREWIREDIRTYYLNY